MKNKVNKEKTFTLIVWITLLLVAIFCSNCATTKRSIKVFSTSSSTGENNTSFSNFTTIEVVENIFPPANKVCVEKYRIDKNYEQCLKFATWMEYIESKYGSSASIFNMEYDHINNQMIIYIK